MRYRAYIHREVYRPVDEHPDDKLIKELKSKRPLDIERSREYKNSIDARNNLRRRNVNNSSNQTLDRKPGTGWTHYKDVGPNAFLAFSTGGIGYEWTLWIIKPDYKL
jgi:hypothetical protein